MHRLGDLLQNVMPMANTTECSVTLLPGTAGVWIRLGEKYQEQGVKGESFAPTKVCF